MKLHHTNFGEQEKLYLSCIFVPEWGDSLILFVVVSRLICVMLLSS